VDPNASLFILEVDNVEDYTEENMEGKKHGSLRDYINIFNSRNNTKVELVSIGNIKVYDQGAINFITTAYDEYSTIIIDAVENAIVLSAECIAPEERHIHCRYDVYNIRTILKCADWIAKIHNKKAKKVEPDVMSFYSRKSIKVIHISFKK
jgi:hypothetical protein